MRRTRVAAIALCVACAVAIEPPVRAASSVLHGSFQQAASPLTLTGHVIRDDGKTHVPNQRVRLRNVDTGETDAEATSGKDGLYSFPVTKPGTYAIEALDADGAVIAVSSPISSTVSPFVRDIVVRTTTKPVAFFFSGKGLAVIAAAAAAGIAVYVISRDGDDGNPPNSGVPAAPGPVSAER
jgi:hypothetical protein